jgi:hypothetical protein
VSIALIVDRKPLAIIGNSLVYRVGAGSYIGYDKIDSPAALYNFYSEKEPVSVRFSSASQPTGYTGRQSWMSVSH